MTGVTPAPPLPAARSGPAACVLELGRKKKNINKRGESPAVRPRVRFRGMTVHLAPRNPVRSQQVCLRLLVPRAERAPPDRGWKYPSFFVSTCLAAVSALTTLNHCLEITVEIGRITSKVLHRALCAYCQVSFGAQVLIFMEDDF